MEYWLSFFGMIIVAMISLVGIIIQTKSKDKQDNIIKKIDDFRKESKEADDRLHTQIVESRMNAAKRYLVNEMTKIGEQHYKPTEKQKALLKDTKDEYNKNGGDSYVDDMYNDLRKKDLL